MPKTKELPRLSVRRTDDVEGLLQALWTLRPELEGKGKLTIVLGLESLIQGCRIPAVVYSPSDTADTAMDSAEEMPEESTTARPNPEMSDDVEWG